MSSLFDGFDKNRCCPSLTLAHMMKMIKSLGVILSYLSVCVFPVEIKAQTKAVLYSELTSPLRGNQAINISLGVFHKNWFHAIGLDYIYRHLDKDKKLDDNDISHAISYKIGWRNTKNDRTNHIFGIHQKVSKFHIYSYDRLEGHINSLPFKKQYSKYTVMAFQEVNWTIGDQFFAGLEFAAGYAIIFQAEYYPRPNYPHLERIDDYIDLSSLFEHGVHRIDSKRNDEVAFQFNINFGCYLN